MEPAWRAPDVVLARDAELDALHSALADARTGQARIAVVDGPPGMGKSTLLRRFLTKVTSARILDASGDELETAVTYGIVEQLVRSAPATVHDADQSAFDGSARLADPPTVGATLGRLFDNGGADEPTVVVIDDLHWADPASLQALSFACRRLRHERVLVLMAVRTQEQERIPAALMGLAAGSRGLRLSLHGLAADELIELSDRLGRGRLSAAAGRRLRDHTEGNPLHAQALLEELTTEQLEQGGLTTPLPAPTSFAALVLDRLAGCPAEGERLVAAASVLGRGCPLRVAAATADLADPLAALESAIDARLLTSGPGPHGNEIRFPHVLVRAAVYHHLGLARAAWLHRRAAAVVDDEGAALRHRAAAADHDPALARELAAFAARQADRGAWSAAAAALLDAFRVEPDRVERDHYLLDALECRIMAADALGVDELLSRLETVADGAHLRYLRARLALIGGDWPTAQRLLDQAWADCDVSADPSLAARISGLTATLLLNLGRSAETVQWARRAVDLDTSTGTPASDAPWVLLLGLGLCGETATALSLAEAQLAEPALPTATRVGALTGRGIVRLWAGDVDGAISDLTTAYETSLRTGPFHTGHIALFYLVDAEYRAGAWADALVHSAAGVAATADQPWFAPLMHAVTAFALAGRGDDERAKHHVRTAEQAAAGLGHAGAYIWAATANARLAHARDDHHAVLDVLRDLPRRIGAADLPALRNPGVQPWGLLEAEAHVRVGNLEDAARAVADLEAGETRPGVLVDLARVRGLLAAARNQHDAADAAFRAGLAHAEHASAPLSHALLQLDYGAVLRRHGRRQLAREQLRNAHAILERLQAQPYLERCERQLRGCGEPVPPAGQATARAATGARTTFTAQEQAVIELVVGGATNREVAAALFVSVKAVEYHLGNIYRKLGIRSRTQLAARLRDAATEPGAVADQPGPPTRRGTPRRH